VTGGGRLLDNSWHAPEAILSSVEIYGPASGTWSTLPALPQARAYHTATLLPDGRVIVTGVNLAMVYIFASALVLGR